MILEFDKDYSKPYKTIIYIGKDYEKDKETYLIQAKKWAYKLGYHLGYNFGESIEGEIKVSN